MLSAAIYLLTHSLLLSLHLAGGVTGSFSRPLSAAEERNCLERLAKGDVEARNTLVEHNLRLVAHIVKKYYALSADQEDLISIGTVGLIKGVSTYRPDKNVRLATYASRCIENEVLMFFRSQRKSAQDLSLSDSIESDREGNALSIQDVLAEEDDMFERVSTDELRRQVREKVDAALDAREAEIIRARYGLTGARAMTQRETAQKLGISRSYVSRIEKKALEKLRRALEN